MTRRRGDLGSRMDGLLGLCSAIDLARLEVETVRAALEGHGEAGAERRVTSIRRQAAMLPPDQQRKFQELAGQAHEARLLAAITSGVVQGGGTTRYVALLGAQGWQHAAAMAEVMGQVLPILLELCAVADGEGPALPMSQVGNEAGDSAVLGLTAALDQSVGQLAPLLVPFMNLALRRAGDLEEVAALSGGLRETGENCLARIDGVRRALGGIDPVPAPWRGMLEDGLVLLAAPSAAPAQAGEAPQEDKA